MKKLTFKIESIPATLWGEKSDDIYIYVHGKMSNKDEAHGFAEKASMKGYQVLSFDLPEHGERIDVNYPCNVWNGVYDLGIIKEYVKQGWRDLYLYGSSLGAYFILLAYSDLTIKKCLLVSPILDMERLIQKIMKWVNVSEQELKDKRIISTTMGETLCWDYYCYVRKNPIIRWNAPTAILYGSEDNLTEREVIENFTKRFNCDLTVLEDGEHWFHTDKQLTFLDKWLDQHI